MVMGTRNGLCTGKCRVVVLLLWNGSLSRRGNRRGWQKGLLRLKDVLVKEVVVGEGSNVNVAGVDIQRRHTQQRVHHSS
jgi:hypothetical protein